MAGAKLNSKLGRAAAKMPDAAAAACLATARAIALAAKQRVAGYSGRIAETVEVEADPSGGYRVDAGDRKAAFFAHIVEGGGAHTPARPFFAPAVEAERAKHTVRVRKALKL